MKHLTITSKQRGAASVIVALLLLIGMGTIAVTTSRTTKMEQQITGNDLRAREAREMAEAGLEYGLAYATESEWVTENMLYRLKNILRWGPVDAEGKRVYQCGPDVPSPSTNCPNLTLPATNSITSGETYTLGSLTYTRIPQMGYNGDLIRVRAVARNTDNSISAAVENYIVMAPPSTNPSGTGGAAGFNMPPPWVTAGCMTTAPTGSPDTYLLAAGNLAVISGKASDNSCLPQGHLDVGTWQDTNGNGVMDTGEYTSNSTTYNRDVFRDSSGNPALCPTPNTNNCAWNHAMNGANLANALAAATDAGNVFTSNIPCGAPGPTPIYRIHNSGPINTGDIVGSCSGVGIDSKTIGTPATPVLLIVPAQYGCPKLNGGITIYGIVYYQSTSACAANGWGGATIYGSVIWEGDVDKPNANSKFIAVDYTSSGGWGSLTTILFPQPAPLRYTVSALPGTWRDF